MRLHEVRSTATEALSDFLRKADDIAVERGFSRELLIRTNHSQDSLLLTGKTAEVLCSYQDDEPVSTADRCDMTIRRRGGRR